MQRRPAEDAPGRSRHRRLLHRAARRRCLPRCPIRCSPPPTPQRWPSQSSLRRRSSGGEEGEKQSVSQWDGTGDQHRGLESKHTLKYVTLSGITSDRLSTSAVVLPPANKPPL